MRSLTNSTGVILGSFVMLTFCLFAPPTVSGQTEKLGAVAYTPVKGWKKTAKENIVTFSEIDAAAGKFCTITLYGSTAGTGKAESDFVREWNNLVVKPFGAAAVPKTETEMADGWTLTAGGAAVDFNGTNAVAFLTVMSSGLRTVSILGVFNHESYMTELAAFGGSIDIEKAAAQIPAPREAPLPPAASAAATTMNAGSLVREFEVNEIRAGQTYIGKVVRISGTINTILVGSDGRIAITFKSTLGAYGNARCYFNSSQSSRVAALSAHTEATVQGTVRGWEGGYSGAKVFVFLDDCIVP